LQNDIASDIMDKKKLKKIKTKIDKLRNRIANIRYTELESIAKSLGRRRYNQGKELVYKSDLLPNSRPLSITKHPGSLNKITAGNILDSLDKDVFDLEEKAEE
jgi:hypothetical protein